MMTAEDWNVRPVREPDSDVIEIPEHILGKSLKMFLKKDVDGLGLVLIEHGSFLQIVSIVGDSSGDRAANLKPGDILVKIGKTNVLGYKLRELRRLVGEIPIGTQLQITVYRNFKDLPDDWKAWTEAVHSNESIQFSNEEGEADWSSSSDDDDDDDDDKDEHLGMKFKNFRPLSLFWHDIGIYLPPISRAWHTLRKNQNVLLVGPHVGCDIVFHHAFENDDISNDYEEEVPSLHYMWSAQSDTASSTSSSSSPADSQWIDQLLTPGCDSCKFPKGKLSQQGPSPHPEQPIKVESRESEEQEESTESTVDINTPFLQSSISSSTESLYASTQSNNTGSGTSISIEDQVIKSSSLDTVLYNTHVAPGKSGTPR